VLLCQHAKNSGIQYSSTCECVTQACLVFLLQDVQAALQRAKEAADAADAAEAQRYALLQAAKLQESAQLQVQLEQVCIPSACRRPATCCIVKTRIKAHGW
jgi:hypothetical protein